MFGDETTARGFELVSDPRVLEVFEQYPTEVRPQLLALRALVLQAAADTPGLTRLEETLKWGEPSYLAKKGSTVRLDWKRRTPDQYALYFKCTSRLVSTFREVFAERLRYEGDRAIVFRLDERVPGECLKRCIGAALRYHAVKHLPTLGMAMA